MNKIQEIRERMICSQRHIEKRRAEILGIIEKPMPTVKIPQKEVEVVEQKNEDTSGE